MRCHQCNGPLGFGLYRYCSNECQENYHIENGTGRAKEMRAQQNSKRVCFDWNLGRSCTEHCGRYGWRHACQMCGQECFKGQGRKGVGCQACQPKNWWPRDSSDA